MARNNSKFVKSLLPGMIAKQNGLCCYCREPIYLGRNYNSHIVVEIKIPFVRFHTLSDETIHTGLLATVEHIKPLALGGTDDPVNLAAACWTCNHNRGKKYQPPDQVKPPPPKRFPVTPCAWCSEPKSNAGKLCDSCRRGKLSMDISYRKHARKRVGKYGAKNGGKQKKRHR